ncbi:MAG: 50S ribosomal protein L3 [Candidatus Marsarchaeota archaeon]|nr:50S ribosomal protein L3 [Candidatus Marsarchaeota archaeon]
MRKGSLEYWPHRRAKKQMPRQRSVPSVAKPMFLNFVAFKAGMTHVTMIDNTESPAKGTEVARAATVLEIPKVYVYGLRFYKKGYAYKQVHGEVFDTAMAAKVGIKKTKHTLPSFKEKISEFTDVSALAYLDASNLGFGNKRGLRFELHIGGNTSSEKLEFAEKYLGKELKILDFAKQGEYVDTTSISKGKGWAGVVKRYGVATQYRKATGKGRHVGTLGPWHPAKVMFGVPQAGHMGYNYRTEMNKHILKLGSQGDANSINPNGGFLNYGIVKNDYMVLDGSIPGPSKRLVRLRKAIRMAEKVREPQLIYISTTSKQGA